MTSTDRSDLVPAQEKLEWVSPSITTWDIEETEKAGFQQKPFETREGYLGGGPS